MRSLQSMPDERRRCAAASFRSPRSAPPASVGVAADASLVQRKACACGGGCPRCRSASVDGEHADATSGVHRQLGHGRGLGLGSGTNYAFDTYQVTESHLSDPDIIARFESLTIRGLLEYRTHVTDPAVFDYITQLVASRPLVPCSTEEVQRTTRLAEEARARALSFLALSRRALYRLHHVWTSRRAELLAGSIHLRSEIVCAFNSNFNITESDPEYGIRTTWVAQRLQRLERQMSAAVAYACDSESSDVCASGNIDTVAYVRGNRPPIHFCIQFRQEHDPLKRLATVIHEYAHLVSGVDDAGGYAMGGEGAQVMTCRPNSKFHATSEVLANTADALTGFVLHIGNTGMDWMEEP